jgi:hypothetical protein
MEANCTATTLSILEGNAVDTKADMGSRRRVAFSLLLPVT